MQQTDEASEALTALLDGQGSQTLAKPPSESTERASKKRKVDRQLIVNELPLESADLPPVDSQDSKLVVTLPRGRRRPSTKPKARAQSPAEDLDDSKWLTIARVGISMVRASPGDSTKQGTERGNYRS